MKFWEDNYIYFQKTAKIICKFNIESLPFRDFYRFFLPFHHISSYLISSNHKRRPMNNKLESLTPEQFTEPMQKHLAELEQVLKLVTPLTLPDERFAKDWLATEYKKKQIPEDAPQLFTDNGEQVRSKSEVIIANSLKATGIPYRYEVPLTLNRRAEIAKTSRSLALCTFHPDFYCLNLRTRKEFIWEHFGMMDDAEYAARAVERLLLYQQNGYLPGKNLIITIETSRVPFSSRAAKQIIEEYLIS